MEREACRVRKGDEVELVSYYHLGLPFPNPECGRGSATCWGLMSGHSDSWHARDG